MKNPNKITNIPPFSVHCLPFSDDYSEAEHGSKDVSHKNRGYYIRSTAELHVEDEPAQSESTQNEPDLDDIAEKVIAAGNLVIAIHGYSVNEPDAKRWYTQIYNYITGNTPPRKPEAKETSSDMTDAEDFPQASNSINNHVLIGYRWPAEKRSQNQRQKIQYAFEALPPLLSGILISTFFIGTITYSLLVQSLTIFCLLSVIIVILGIFVLLINKSFNFKFSLVAGGLISLLGIALYALQSEKPWYPGLLSAITMTSVFLGTLVITIIIIRVLNYSRDLYRASNYGTTDLVELIRQLNQKIFEKLGSPKTAPNNIELSFIGHSLGCDVLTHAVRILSDVFDPDAQKQNPEKHLGEVFKLGQLVLVAPDIPVEAILSGRANFLKSSLRRFRESYVFCNEADLALRLASTAANYISFPARSRFRGYKLGNISAQHFENQLSHKGNKPTYGIVNTSGSHLENGGLEIRSSTLEHLNLVELATIGKKKRHDSHEKLDINKDELLSVAREFTFFDCTDYTDTRIDYFSGEITTKSTGVVSYALGQPALNFVHYVCLALSSPCSKRLEAGEGHGGYFRGKFSQDLIYGLAFLGKDDYCKSFGQDSFDGLHKIFEEKKIQVILSC